MKACNLYGLGDLRYEEVAAPAPKAGEVLLKIKASGICGSDIPRVYSKGTYHFPTIPGHEFAGQVVDTGIGTDASLIGRRAAVFPLLPCKKCSSCQIGEYAQCTDYNYFGSRCDGGFAEFISVPVWNLVEVGDGISFEEAAMAEPAAVAIHALRRGGIEIGDNVVIFGAGPIGLLLAQWSYSWGADAVILVDIDESKVDFARKLGFDYVWNSMDGDPQQFINEVTRGVGADIAVEGAGVSSTLEGCLKVVRPFGKVIAMGNPSGEMRLSQKAYWELLRKQLKIYGTWNSSFVDLPKNDFKLAVRAMEKGTIDVKPFITHRFQLSQCNEAFQLMKERKTFYNKIMFVMD